jgi:histidinol-phosphate phosphatase family protein
VRYDVVIPTAGRESLARLLDSLAEGDGPRPARTIVVDDRPEPAPIERPGIEVLASGGRGPAAARNVGWRAATAEWVAFLDDDVVAPPGWRALLADDLADLPACAAGSQGAIRVPLADERRLTDWERNVRGLEDACWATADMAYRRSALAAVGGFDERFRRAYREDAELGLRLVEAGFEIHAGSRHVIHPVRPVGPGVSVRLQAGNADDALMRALHGRDWRERAGAPAGRLPLHVLTTAAGLAATAALAAGRRRAAGVAAAAWAAATAEFAWRRIAPGPRTANEIATMTWTSAALPPAAVLHRLRGELRARRQVRPGALAAPPPATRPAPAAALHASPAARPAPSAARPPAAVLLDRDGTLVHDVPYNGDPAAVRPMPGARDALERLRAAGVRLAVVSNQSGVGRGLLSESDVRAVNARIEELLGPLGPWMICPHAPDDGCTCRKPAPGLIVRASDALRVPASECVVVGDIGADVAAARAAGARSVLVPTRRTRAHEIAGAPAVAASLDRAVDLILAGEAAA